jgi:putative transposase
MGKLKRHVEEEVAFFVTTVTKERRLIFRDPKLCRILLVTIEYYKIVFDYQVYGYCLMPDYLHLLLKPEGRFNLSFVMKMIKGSFARKVNRLADKEGSIWQAGFYDEAIRTEKQLYNQLEYMHQNPVQANLVSTPAKYPFSSFGQYHGLKHPEGFILTVDPF